MSFSATCWAWSIEGLKSSEKLTLLAMCQYANEEKRIAYPAIGTISDCTGLNKKTVQSNIVKLIEKGLLVDTGKRVGKTLSCRVFHVPFLTYKELSEATPKTGTLNSGAIPKTDLSDPKNGQEAIPKTGSKPVIEPVTNQRQQIQDLLDKGFEIFWANWHRKQDKENAQKAFIKLCKPIIKRSEDEYKSFVEKITTHAVERITYIKKQKEENPYYQAGFERMLPSTYLNNARWEDEYNDQ
jgi:hypothetical protein